MASLTCTGIDQIRVQFEKLAKGSDAACQKAVKAGAQLLAEKLGAAAPVDTGALQGSVKAGAVKYDAGDGWNCEVKPVGTNHGESLAKIGNILEYGRSDGKSHRPWFNNTIIDNTGAVIGAMQAAFEQSAGK